MRRSARRCGGCHPRRIALQSAGFLSKHVPKSRPVKHIMAEHSTPHFQNDQGVRKIEIGVREFMCCGATAPFDHPHVFLDMGDESEIVCPYCSTLFRYSSKLKVNESIPAGCLYEAAA
jgi:uncharacterized Zn-finger protein